MKYFLIIINRPLTLDYFLSSFYTYIFSFKVIPSINLLFVFFVYLVIELDYFLSIIYYSMRHNHQYFKVMETVSINYLCVYFVLYIFYFISEDIKWRELNFKNQYLRMVEIINILYYEGSERRFIL